MGHNVKRWTQEVEVESTHETENGGGVGETTHLGNINTKERAAKAEHDMAHIKENKTDTPQIIFFSFFFFKFVYEERGSILFLFLFEIFFFFFFNGSIFFFPLFFSFFF